MARIRSVKPETFKDQDLAEDLPGPDGRDARLLYVGLWGLADEHGRLRGDARSIKGELFAYDDDLTPDAIDRLVDMLVATDRAIRYNVGRSIYLFLPKLAKHQRLEPHKTPSRLPEPPAGWEEGSAPNESENFPDNSGNDPDEFAPKQAASSKEHVAGSREQIPNGPEPVPSGADQAARLIIDATGAEPWLAADAVLAIAAERKPRNLPGLVRKLVDAGELPGWLAKARKTSDAQAVSAAVGAARASPECAHGQPGGEALHPVSGKPLCPLCRKGTPP